MLPALAHEITEAAPGWGMPRIHPQGFCIAALCLCLTTWALGPPKIAQICVHIHLCAAVTGGTISPSPKLSQSGDIANRAILSDASDLDILCFQNHLPGWG
jgi:hypothetical protein